MSNLRTVEIPRNAFVVNPDFQLMDVVETLLQAQESRTRRQQEYFGLGDCDGQSPYSVALAQIDAAIGRLKQARCAMQSLSQHQHQWDASDYCAICGADGRA